MITFVIGAMFLLRGFTRPSLSNAHTPVHTVNAPSLPDIVLPVMVMFLLALCDQTLMAASGDGMAVPFRHGIMAFANSAKSRVMLRSDAALWYGVKPRYWYLLLSLMFRNL